MKHSTGYEPGILRLSPRDEILVCQLLSPLGEASVCYDELLNSEFHKSQLNDNVTHRVWQPLCPIRLRFLVSHGLSTG